MNEMSDFSLHVPVKRNICRVIFLISQLMIGIILASACGNGSVEHIRDTRLIILQPIALADGRFDGNFRAMLELLYPHQCHDTAFIQDKISLERIDLPVQVKHEFTTQSNQFREFFDRNNPEKQRTFRTSLFFKSNSAFEKNPDRQFFLAQQISGMSVSNSIGNYLLKYGRGALIYLITSDSTCRNYQISGVQWRADHDFARLNCRIVEDLKKIDKTELPQTTVILIALPPNLAETTMMSQETGAGEEVEDPYKGTGLNCPPDSVVDRINRQRTTILLAFRNLLYYIATTNDADLKTKYRDDALAEIQKIPKVKIEGIPDKDLPRFLFSGFARTVMVFPVENGCKVITGVRISEW
jgi:hypothetical protein